MTLNDQLNSIYLNGYKEGMNKVIEILENAMSLEKINYVKKEWLEVAKEEIKKLNYNTKE